MNKKTGYLGYMVVYAPHFLMVCFTINHHKDPWSLLTDQYQYNWSKKEETCSGVRCPLVGWSKGHLEEVGKGSLQQILTKNKDRCRGLLYCISTNTWMVDVDWVLVQLGIQNRPMDLGSSNESIL